jgi:hypothetical protein
MEIWWKKEEGCTPEKHGRISSGEHEKTGMQLLLLQSFVF